MKEEKANEAESVPLRGEHGGPNWERIKRDIKEGLLFQKAGKPVKRPLSSFINDPGGIKQK